MAVTNWKSPSAYTEVELGSLGLEPWQNPTNVYISDDLNARSDVKNASQGKGLVLTGFGFADAEPNGVPSGATIDGIEVQVEGRASVLDKLVDSTEGHRCPHLYLSATNIGNPKNSATYWPNTEEIRTYPATGGATDKWGTTVDAADVRNTSFGVCIGYRASSSAFRQQFVDHVQMRIHYTDSVGEAGTVTESATLAAAQTAIGHYGASVTESASAADAKGGLAGLIASLSDSAATSETAAALKGALAAIAEGITTGDTWVGEIQTAATIVEGIVAGDSVAAIAAKIGAVSDAVTLGELYEGVVQGANLGVVTENSNAAAQFVASAGKLASLTEAQSVADVVSGIAALIGVVSASATIADSYVGQKQGLPGELTEAVSVVFATTALSRLVGAVSESVTATDLAEVAGALLGTVLENVTAGALYTALGAYNQAIAESLTIRDEYLYEGGIGFLAATITVAAALQARTTVAGGSSGGVIIND